MVSDFTTPLGEAKRAHGEAQAERMLDLGLRILGVKRKELEKRPKGLAEKEALAWWLRGRTIVGRRWIAERLWMGNESRVSKAIGRVNRGEDKRLRLLRNRLMEGATNGQ